MGKEREKQRANKRSNAQQASKKQRIEKRPLIHPPVTSGWTGPQTPKVVYMSARSPFVSVIKRVQTLLAQIDGRDTRNTGGRKPLPGDYKDFAKMANGVSREPREAVLVKATGRAIENALHVALHFQERNGYVVHLRTGNAATVDDIIDDGLDGIPVVEDDNTEEVREEEEVEVEEEEAAETQFRRMPMLEIAISER